MMNEKTFWGNEPKIIDTNNNLDVCKALNWYNYNIDSKQLKKELLKYLKDSNNINYNIVKKVPENRLLNSYSIFRILNNGNKFEDMKFINSLIDRAAELSVNSSDDLNEDDTISKPTISIQERIKNKQSEIISQVDEWLDENNKDIKFYDEFLKLNISNQTANVIINKYNLILDEINLCLNKSDEQCIEAYSHMSKSEMKEYKNILENLVHAAEMIKNRTLKIRKVKAKKPISKDKLVSKLKYKVEDTALKLVSINPVDVLEKDKIFIYNIKSRVLYMYEAQTNFKLGIKGTSLLNFSESSSYSKKIRKPEEFFKGFKKINKEFEKTFISVKSTKGKVNGRISSDCIILG